MNIKKRVFSRGQITPFIIIGLVVLIIISASLYLSSISRKAPFELKEDEVTGPKLESTLSLYVQECIRKEANGPLVMLGMQGGTLAPSDADSLYYNRTKVKYMCYAEGLDPSLTCVNSMLTKEQMEYELSAELDRRLRKCINLNEFRRFVSDITSGEMSVQVTIAKDDIVVEVHYPVSMKLKDSEIDVSDFSSTLDYPLGRLYSASQIALNDEIRQDYFDIDRWMDDNGADVMIEKHRPYPDTVYILRKNNYTFQFSIQGIASAGQYVGAKKNYYGCCINARDSLCFKNTDPLRCVELQGEYNPNAGCSCTIPYEAKDQCFYDYCYDCNDIGKKNGESWCIYDTITGKGNDYVGSRHYKQSCVNGTVYTEECKDYREELCTEREEEAGTQQSKETIAKAVCRPNRWYSCSQCDSEQCCDDGRYRDCYWDSSLGTDKKCMPQVPPGLRFWENEGADICLRGNQQKRCEGLSCPQQWLDSAAAYCYKQGDCGNYRNINDALASGGFYDTDILNDASDSAYPPAGLNRGVDANNTPWRLSLPFERDYPSIISSGKEKVNPLSLFVSTLSNFFDELSKIEPSAYANPFVNRKKIEITDFSICNLWNAPSRFNDCSICSSDPEKPCSEYRCMSLGESCMFEMKEGMPSCGRMFSNDFVGPIVDADKDAMKGYTLERSYLGPYWGYTIQEPVKPHKPFTFAIKTDEDTKCTMSLTPRIGNYSLQTVVLGDSVFRKEHNITIRMPPRLAVPGKLLNAINFTPARNARSLIYNIRGVLDSIANNLGNGLSMYSRITGKDFMDQVSPKADRISNLIRTMTSDIDNVVSALLDQFDNGGYYVFFDCTDRAGNRNKDQIFIRFTVDANYADNEPPVIVQAEPKNNGRISPSANSTTLKIYVDEPAECRYDSYDTDYTSMANSFSCPALGYETSPVAGGTYECTTDIMLPNQDNYLFIRCADNPGKTDEYILRLSGSGNDSIQLDGIENFTANISYASPLDYIRISGNELDVPAGMLDRLSFSTNLSEVNLNIYIDDMKQCRISSEEKSFEDMETVFSDCQISDDVMKGVYRCSVILYTRLPEQAEQNIENNISDNASNADQISMNMTDAEQEMHNVNGLYYIKCRDSSNTSRNINSESYIYKLSKAEELQITELRPSGVLNTTIADLSVRVSGDIMQSGIQCGYNDDPYSYLIMPRSGKDAFKVGLPELEEFKEYSYYVECVDKYGSRTAKTLKFKAIK